MASSTQVPPQLPSPADSQVSFVEEVLPPARRLPSLLTPRVPRHWRSQPWHWALLGGTGLLLLAVIGVALRKEPAPAPPTHITTPASQQWVTAQKFTGARSMQTGAFHVEAGDRIEWTVAPSDSPANFCSIELYSLDGVQAGLVANVAHLGSGEWGSYVIHSTGDVYLVVALLNFKYMVMVEALE